MEEPVDISQGVVTVCEYESDRRTMNSFKENMKAMIHETASPGRTRGRDVDRSICFLGKAVSRLKIRR